MPIGPIWILYQIFTTHALDCIEGFHLRTLIFVKLPEMECSTKQKISKHTKHEVFSKESWRTTDGRLPRSVQRIPKAQALSCRIWKFLELLQTWIFWYLLYLSSLPALTQKGNHTGKPATHGKSKLCLNSQGPHLLARAPTWQLLYTSKGSAGNSFQMETPAGHDLELTACTCLQSSI